MSRSLNKIRILYVFKKGFIDLNEGSVLKLVKWNKSCRYIFLTAKLVQGEFAWPCKAFDLYLHVSRELFQFLTYVCVLFLALYVV